MPIFEYECTRCGRHVEEIQKFDDPPPVIDDPCPGPPRDPEATRDEEIAPACDLVRVPTTFTQRWNGDYSNDGRGGWVRQPNRFDPSGNSDTMVKMTPGKNSTRYGEGSV
jgi:hypothetical protein